MNGNSDKKSWHRDLQSAVSAAVNPDYEKDQSKCDRLEDNWTSLRSRLGDLNNKIDRLESEVKRLKSDRDYALNTAAIEAAVGLVAAATGPIGQAIRALRQARKLKALNKSDINQLITAILPFGLAARELLNAREANQKMKDVGNKLEGAKQSAESVANSIRRTHDDWLSSGCNRLRPSVGT